MCFCVKLEFIRDLEFVCCFFVLIVLIDFIIEGVGLSFRIEVVFLQNMAMWAHPAAVFITFQFGGFWALCLNKTIFQMKIFCKNGSKICEFSGFVRKRSHAAESSLQYGPKLSCGLSPLEGIGAAFAVCLSWRRSSRFMFKSTQNLTVYSSIFDFLDLVTILLCSRLAEVIFQVIFLAEKVTKKLQ